MRAHRSHNRPERRSPAATNVTSTVPGRSPHRSHSATFWLFSNSTGLVSLCCEISVGPAEILAGRAPGHRAGRRTSADRVRQALRIPATAADTTAMVPSLADIRTNRRIMAYTAAAIYGIAGLDGAIGGLLPSDPPFALVPIIVVFVMFALLAAFGPRLPRQALALLGPLGVVLIAYALITTPGPTDAAVLYALPVFWTTFFFGRWGAVAILVCVAIAHAIALLAMP